MFTLKRKIAATSLICVVAAMGAVPAANAAPESCNGAFLISDAVGDQTYKVQGQNAAAAPANTDVVGLFFRVDEGKVTANIVMEDLTLAIPQGFQAIRYRAYFTIDDTVRYVQALATSGGVAYTYGGDFEGVAYAKDGDTTGAVFEGKKGVIQIVLPADAGGTPGTKLDATSASIGLLTIGSAPEEGQTPPVYFGVDTAPDGAADGPSVTPAECAPAAEAPTTEPPGNNPTPPAETPGSPAPGGPGSQPAATELRLTLARASLAAKKANSKRSASLVLKSSEALSAVSAKLMRGSKTLGSATLAEVSGSGTLKLKLKGKLKKGAHKLVVTGKRADGSAFTTTLKVTVTG
jgi:hypothetical protein